MNNTEDIIKVLRVIEYVGPRSRVEAVINKSITGTRDFKDLKINVATLGEYPEILK